MLIIISLLCVNLHLLSVECRLVDSALCSGDGDCGWNSYCDNGQCWCRPGYQRSTDSNHCLDSMCDVPSCLTCLDDKTCKRCTTYLLSGVGRCIERCNTDYTLMLQGNELGRVCQGEPPGISMVYVSIIIAVGSAVLLVVLLVLAIHFKIKTDKERALRLELMGELLTKEKRAKVAHEITQSPAWDSYSYESSDDECRLKRLHYYHQVAALRPQLDTFLAMLRDAKLKCHSLGPNESRQLLYRNLIHQLCRVLTVINDRMAPMPAEGNLLLDWAQRVLTDYKRYQPSPRASSCWTLPNEFTHVDRFMNGSLPTHRLHTSTPQSGSPSQRHETDREVAEINIVQLLANVTDPIEV